MFRVVPPIRTKQLIYSFLCRVGVDIVEIGGKVWLQPQWMSRVAEHGEVQQDGYYEKDQNDHCWRCEYPSFRLSFLVLVLFRWNRLHHAISL